MPVNIYAGMNDLKRWRYPFGTQSWHAFGVASGLLRQAPRYGHIILERRTLCCETISARAISGSSVSATDFHLCVDRLMSACNGEKFVNMKPRTGVESRGLTCSGVACAAFVRGSSGRQACQELSSSAPIREQRKALLKRTPASLFGCFGICVYMYGSIWSSVCHVRGSI